MGSTMIRVLVVSLTRKLVVSVYARTRAVHVFGTYGRARRLGGVGPVNSPRELLTEAVSADLPKPLLRLIEGLRIPP